jgi:uncharacterized protein YjiS (DUF1127 family)
MANPCFSECRTRDGSTVRGAARGLRALAWLVRAAEVARQRRALMRLGDTALKDIGVSRADAWREGTRHWWDLPE